MIVYTKSPCVAHADLIKPHVEISSKQIRTRTKMTFNKIQIKQHHGTIEKVQMCVIKWPYYNCILFIIKLICNLLQNVEPKINK